MNYFKSSLLIFCALSLLSMAVKAVPKEPVVVLLDKAYDLGFGSNLPTKPGYDLLDARGGQGNGCKVLLLPMQKTGYAFVQFCVAPGNRDTASFDRAFVYQKGHQQQIRPLRAELKLAPHSQLNFEFIFQNVLFKCQKTELVSQDLMKLPTWPGLEGIKLGGMDD